MSVLTELKLKVGKRREMNFVIERYESAMIVVNDCKSRKITDPDFDNISEKKGISKSWEGVNSYNEALEYMSNGYQPTVEALKDKLKFTAAGDGKRMSFQNNIVGYNPIVPLAMMGVPNCMIDTKIKPIKCKVIDVYYDMTQSCGTSPKTIIESGQKLLGVITELEHQGYRFNLYAVQSYSDDEGADLLVVKVKSSNQPIDLKRISFPLTHVAFFRVIGFDWYSKCPKAKYRTAYGHALSFEFNKDELKDFSDKAFGSNSIYISGRMLNENPEDYIKEVLVNVGQRKAK